MSALTAASCSMRLAAAPKATASRSAPRRTASARRTPAVVCNAGDARKVFRPTSARPEADFVEAIPSLMAVTSIHDPTMGPGKAPPPMHVAQQMQSVLGQLFHQRIIRMGGAVDDDMANLIVAQLLYLDSEDAAADINMYVNSPGGSVTAGMAIFDTMRYIRPDVATTCVGLAASMGAFLLSAGHQGKRYTLPNSRIMIHQPLGGAQGQAADIEIQANEIMHHKATLSAYIAEFTGQTLNQIIEDTDRDFFMSAADAKAYGLVDHVIATPKTAGADEVEMYPPYELKY